MCGMTTRSRWLIAALLLLIAVAGIALGFLGIASPVLFGAAYLLGAAVVAALIIVDFALT
jgi:hypothetical protein